MVPRIADLPAHAWDALFPGTDPFVTHGFLAALETHGCVGGDSGWQPAHLVLEDRGGSLMAAMPRYRKLHSWGEFVFDFAWAEAAMAAGLAYYPKAVAAIPYTPVTGPRLGAANDAARRRLAEVAHSPDLERDLSSFHALFLEPADADELCACGALLREDVRFEWRSRGEADFEAFLARLRHDKRKKIRRERRRVAEAGIRFEWTPGDALTEADWSGVHALYADTYHRRGQAAYLTMAFFLDHGRVAGTPVRVLRAFDGMAVVAVALLWVAGRTLYGRHWGCAEHYAGLHFEACYHQGIEFCLREGLGRFDAGVQGAHKRTRGFDPVLTRSAHVLHHDGLRAAVDAHLVQERRQVRAQHNVLARHSAFRRTTGAAGTIDG